MANHAEFEELKRQLRNVADEGDARADNVLKHVDDYLGTDEPSQEHHEGLLGQLRDAVHHFEADHPRVTEALQQVVNSLTAAGI